MAPIINPAMAENVWTPIVTGAVTGFNTTTAVAAGTQKDAYLP
jgi:hypothetical protein